jgi:cAMP-dependent protein kinase regulator
VSTKKKREISVLRDEAAKAVEKNKLRDAIKLYEELEERQPADAGWPKRIGEVLRRIGGEDPAAIAAFERAVDKYCAAGFLVQAIAVCKLILQLDPAHPTATAKLAESAPKRRATAPPVGAKAVADRAAAAPPAKPPRAPMIAPAPDQVAEIRNRPPRISGAYPSVAIPRGAGLDAVPLAEVVPGAQPLLDADGTPSGRHVIPIDEDVEELEELELEMIADDFSSKHTAIDLAIAAAEPELDVPPPPAHASPTARRALLATPLLADLPPKALETLIHRLRLIDLPPGEVVFREGDAGDCLYVVTEGEVVVESAAAGELAWLGPGSFFGEIALVTDLPRSATVRAGAGPALLLAIDRDVVRDLIADHPSVLAVILRFLRERLVAKVTRTSELFRPFDDVERMALTSRFELVEVAPGAPLIVQGQRADGLYVTLAGKVEVWRDGSPTAVATLGAGEVFGEMSLLAGGGSTAHCRAATRVLALRMPVRVFQEVIMTHPLVLQYVGELAERRKPAEEGGGEFVDLHLDLI